LTHPSIASLVKIKATDFFLCLVVRVFTMGAFDVVFLGGLLALVGGSIAGGVVGPVYAMSKGTNDSGGPPAILGATVSLTAFAVFAAAQQSPGWAAASGFSVFVAVVTGAIGWTFLKE
jgi:hypothetical protein